VALTDMVQTWSSCESATYYPYIYIYIYKYVLDLCGWSRVRILIIRRNFFF